MGEEAGGRERRQADGRGKSVWLKMLNVAGTQARAESSASKALASFAEEKKAAVEAAEAEAEAEAEKVTKAEKTKEEVQSAAAKAQAAFDAERAAAADSGSLAAQVCAPRLIRCLPWQPLQSHCAVFCPIDAC